MKIAITLIAALTLLSGCAVYGRGHGHSHHDRFEPIRIETHRDNDYDRGHDHNHGRFCPPGQAKHGRC